MLFSEKVAVMKERQGFTTEQLSEKSGVPIGTINKILNGETQNPTGKTLAKLALALGCSLEYLYGDEENASERSIFELPGILPIGKQKLPVLGSVSCGEPTFAEEEMEFYVDNSTRINADFILRAKGDSMIGARIYDGDLVFVRKQPDVDDGQIAVVLIDDETLLKRVYKLRDGRRELRAENPKYKPIMIGGRDETRTIQILGRAVALQTDVI